MDGWLLGLGDWTPPAAAMEKWIAKCVLAEFLLDAFYGLIGVGDGGGQKERHA